MKIARTKQLILTLLKRNHEMTIDGFMEYFSISEIAIRKHIHELENQGLIKAYSRKQKIGRPRNYYELTESANRLFPNQYESLPVELLRDLEELQGEDAVLTLLEKRMQKELVFFQSEISSTNFDDKVARVAELQEKRGYMVEVEKKVDGSYEMKHFNCPIANIANAYEQVCKNEHKVFRKIFSDSYVDCSACMTSGDHYCNWVIHFPSENEKRSY